MYGSVVTVQCVSLNNACGAPRSPEHVMEGHIPSAVQSLHLVAHVFEQQLVFVQVHLQPASEQTKQELHPGCRDHALGEQSRESQGYGRGVEC